MDQKRWLQIEDVLQQALDVEPSQRPAFLKRACINDATLRAQVEALLDRESDAGTFMEAPALASLIQQHSIEPGSQIGRYRIKSHIGAGGMGEVYKARDETLGRVVALKMLPLEFISDGERVQRFRQEAFAASRLNHPNIITIFEIVEQDGNHFIAQEYVEGQTLRELLTDPGTKKPLSLSVDKALEIAIQIARALKAAHTAWIIHRDIKPENIMIREDGLVKVVDFGIAKLGDEGGPATNTSTMFQSNDPSLTVPGLILGTASYMSPEQARGEQLDGRTDLFSLGILLYEMIAGSRLFAGTTRVEPIERLQHSNDVVRRGLKLSHVPKELERILRRALQSNRDERYASVSELLDDLIKFKRHLESKTTRRIVGVSALVVVLALVVVGVAAFLSVNETWEERILRDGHTAAVRRAVFSPDGKLLVSAGEDNKVIVWDFARRMPLKTFSEHKGVITTVSFSPDGKWFFTGDEQQTAIVWDAKRLEPAAVWRDQFGRVSGSAFSPDGRVVVYAAGSVSLVRETTTWKKLLELPLELGFGEFLFPEDHVLADTHGGMWDLYTGELLREGEKTWAGNWAAISPDRKQVASIDSSGYLRFADLERRKVITQVHGHHDHGRAVAYSPDGKLLATAAERVVLWDVASRTKLLPLEYESIVWSVAFSPDGRWLVSTHGDGSILIWDITNRELEANLRQHSGGVRAIAFSPDGKRLATTSEDHSVILWDASGRKEAVFNEHKTRVAAVAFSQDGRWVISADQSGKLIFRDLIGGETRVITPPEEGPSYCVAISPEGRFVATSLLIQNAETGEVLVPYVRQWHAVYSAAFIEDGKLLIGVTDNGHVVILETGTWREIARQRWTESPLVSMSISPDGKYIVTGEDDRKVRFGTINPLQQLGVIGEHNARVKAVAFSPDGKYVASAGDDKMVALWEVNRRKLVTTIGTHTSPIYALAFSPDGRHLLTGEHDRSVRQYTRRRTLWGYKLSD
jgi:eukaryotic-like serine/threonine-protein kinase